MTRMVAFLGIASVVALDQWIKRAAALHLKPILQTRPFLGLRLHYVENTGAAFSFLQNAAWPLSVVTGLLLVGCLVLLLTKRIRSRVLYYALAAVTAGGLGNLMDRVLRGYVVDYIEPVFVRFAVFNLADCFITVGACVMLFWVLFRRQELGNH